MSIEESLIEELRGLPPEKQREALRFVESLQQQRNERHPRRSLKGLWAGLSADVTAENIDQARREMRGGFPRKNVP